MSNKPVKNIYKNVISIILAFSMVLFTFGVSGNYALADSVKGYVKSGTSNLRVRVTAGGDIMTDSNGNTIYLQGDQELDILDRTNSSWYKVAFTYHGENMNGFVSSAYIVIKGEEPSTEGQGSSGEGTTEAPQPPSSSDFEAKLSAQNFPESYKSYLRSIHESYPAWEFVAVHTGLDWATVVENERCKSGQVKNLVNCTSGAPHYNWRATVVGYNWATDKWSSYDGSTWFAASQGFVEYYLDPRTYLSSSYIFAFESLSYQEGVQNIQGVEAILKGTFMYDAVPKGESQKYSEIILEAAKTYSISAYHLASRMKQEMGSSGGTAALGTNSTYPGIYNYFNIGAYDSSSGNAVTNGLKWAATSGSYGRPWNSIKKAIMGGAQYLASAYISVGQNTLYTQKFNVTNKNSLYSHQYMSNVQAPASEGYSVYKAYVSNGIIGSSMVFEIPVYKNMPQSACPKPADSGNPNNWLKSLNVSNYTLTPSFSVSSTTEYSLIVAESVSSVNISASTVNSNAKISGTGTINLNKGTNVVTITVTAQNGNVKNYTLTIVRQGGSSGTVTPSTSQGTQSTTEAPSSGQGKKGDLNGDGKITAIDIVKVQRLIVGLDSTTDEVKKIADINGDGKITAIDIVMIQRHIVGIQAIN